MKIIESCPFTNYLKDLIPIPSLIDLYYLFWGMGILLPSTVKNKNDFFVNISFIGGGGEGGGNKQTY